MRYRRIFQPGGTFFFTIVTYKRMNLFSLQGNVDLLLDVFHEIQQRHSFDVIAQVIMPDHIHSIWKLPHDDIDYPNRWRLIKGTFTRKMIGRSNLDVPLSRKKKNEQTIWQRRYWEHTIRDNIDLERHIDYIHFNPVHHGFTDRPYKWNNSTFRRYVDEGYYPLEWSTDLLFKDVKGVGSE